MWVGGLRRRRGVGPAQAAEAAAALLQMHSAGSSKGSEAEAAPQSPLASTCTTAALVAAGRPVLAASHPIYRPQALHTPAAPAALMQQKQQQSAVAAAPRQHPAICKPPATAATAAPPAASQLALQLLPLVPPPASLDTGIVSADVLAQARAWLSAVLAQQEQERRLVEQCTRVLLLQALQREQQRRLAAGRG